MLRALQHRHFGDEIRGPLLAARAGLRAQALDGDGGAVDAAGVDLAETALAQFSGGEVLGAQIDDR